MHDPFDHHRRGKHGRGRQFDYGELRLLLLALIAQHPRHGYELIKAIEERTRGAYSPSPGVMYPTLAWLDDMGYAKAQTEGGGRKRYQVTPEGEAFLASQREAADELLARTGQPEPGHSADKVPAPILRAMENLRCALRLRLQHGPLDAASIEHLAATLDSAALTIERST